jgi:hypothetical protein
MRLCAARDLWYTPWPVRPRGALLAITLSACASTQPPPPSTPRAPDAPLVVSMVVDQFPAWVVAERIPLLPADGGFARLRREGTWHRQLRYLHAATDTAPGHSALFTGRPPRESGILANELPNGRGGRASILDDPERPRGDPGRGHRRAVVVDRATARRDGRR